MRSSSPGQNNNDDDSPVNSVEEAIALARLLTPVAKSMCSKAAIAGLQECMESLGGVGYLEDEGELNIARLFRDVNVQSIWEGTADVMATDVVRVFKGRQGPAILADFEHWVERHLKTWTTDKLAQYTQTDHQP